MSKTKLIVRLSWYFPLERFNAFLFIGVMIAILILFPIRDILLLLYGLLLMAIILFQGQHYWKLKLYGLTGKSFDQAKSLEFFRKSKRFNIYMIILIPLFFLLQLHLSNWTIMNRDHLTLWAIIANIFGILEYINYYHTQLMIDNLSDLNYLIKNRRLKIASLKKDLDENKL